MYLTKVIPISQLLHYENVSSFKKKYYSDILTQEHLNPSEIRIDKVSFPDGGVTEQFNFWGYVLQKNGKKYLLPSRHSDGTEVNIFDLLPIQPKDLQKVAYNKEVYFLINRPISVKFRPEKRMTFKELCDKLNDFDHSNKNHRLLLVFMSLSQLMDRANFRVCSVPGFGKDSVIDIFGSLIGGSCTVEQPTLAKLEYLTSNKLLAVNEIVNCSPEELRIINQFLLSAGAFKPEITKHSRASDKTKETLDIKHFSLSLFYNDLDCYKNLDKYFDFVTTDQVKDRFPAFRLHGVFQEDFNKYKGTDSEVYVEKHYEEYKDLIYTFNYFKGNIEKELKHFVIRDLVKVSSRWSTSIGRLLKIVDLYCTSQEEFDSWIQVINESIMDYKLMTGEYAKLLESRQKVLPPRMFEELVDSLKSIDSTRGKISKLTGKVVEDSKWFK